MYNTIGATTLQLIVDLFNFSGDTFESSVKARLSKEIAQANMIGIKIWYWINPYPQS
jgi:hypothetical protein